MRDVMQRIRTRVERLSFDWPSAPEPVIVHWKDFCQQCPACGADLAADAEARAVAAASTARARGDFGQVFYWAEALTRCPRCGAPLSS